MLDETTKKTVRKPLITKLSIDEVMNATPSSRPHATIEDNELCIRIPLDPCRISGKNENGDYSMVVLAETPEFTMSVPIEHAGKTQIATLRLQTRIRNDVARAQLSLTL